MDKLTKGALGATIVVMLGAVAFAFNNSRKLEKDNLALRQQILDEQRKREDSKTAELERQLKESETRREQTASQFAAQLAALRTEMASAAAAAAADRRVEESEREQLSRTIEDKLRNEEEELAATMSPLQKKIRDAVPIGQVTEVNAELGLAIVNAGSSSGMQPEKRFNVRRDAFIVGEVVIQSVADERNSIANIDSSKSSPGLTIRPGDELIGYPLY